MPEPSVSTNAVVSKKAKYTTALKLGITLFLATLLWLSLATVAIA